MLVNCSVCLGDINLFDKEVSILNCGHFFHSQCLNNWLAKHMNCPECRAIVTRNNFARNIFPKLNEETASKLKMLEDKCEILQNKVLMKKEKGRALRNEIVRLNMWNSAFKDSQLIICSICIYNKTYRKISSLYFSISKDKHLLNYIN